MAFRFFKRLVCDCEGVFREDVEELAPAGVTLGWSGRPELLRRWIGTCPKCGARKVKRGYVPYRAFEDFKRDEKDWPLMKNGTPYPIAAK